MAKSINIKGDLRPPGGPAAATPATSLYIHVPFCRAKCRYCDFYSMPIARAAHAVPDYVAAVAAELQMHRDAVARPAETVFIGGGTPTALPPQGLEQLLALAGRFAGAITEFSVEANPATVTGQTAAMLAAAGVNRVSLGAQSFDEKELATLGRVHGRSDIAEAVAMLRQAGLENISLDLIYGIPGQTMATWQGSLHSAIDLGVAHLSCYGLSVEDGTPLAAAIAHGDLEEADEQLQRDCYYAAIEAAEGAGLNHYEISNFARPGRQCRHNLTYWRNLPYLGAGPAAASFIDGDRRTNDPDLARYCQAMLAGRQPPSSSEHLTGKAAMAETMMLGLRLIDGVDRAGFAERFGQDPLEAFAKPIEHHRQMGSLVVTDRTVRLSREALFVSDSVLADIIADVR